MKVTTATNSSGAWLKGSSGFTILPLSKCPGYSKCKADTQNPGDFPAPPKINQTVLDNLANATTQTEEAADAAGPLFFAVNQPVGVGGSPGVIPGLSRSSRMCTPSNLGYQCSISVAQGVVVHYSHGGHPPMNVCTNKTTLERAARNSSSLMHFAIETDQQVGQEDGRGTYLGLSLALCRTLQLVFKNLHQQVVCCCAIKTASRPASHTSGWWRPCRT